MWKKAFDSIEQTTVLQILLQQSVSHLDVKIIQDSLANVTAEMTLLSLITLGDV